MVLMHNRDTVDGSLDIFDEVIGFLEGSIAIATAAGVPRSQIVVDPGIGFGKTPRQNLDLIRELDRLNVLGCPILPGKAVDERMAASVGAALAAVAMGARVVRVHDVGATVDALKVWAAIADETKVIP